VLFCVVLQDVEDQATAGLDLQMAEALARLSNTTGLQETQVSGKAAWNS
jgi:hypothetical protein